VVSMLQTNFLKRTTLLKRSDCWRLRAADRNSVAPGQTGAVSVTLLCPVFIHVSSSFFFFFSDV